MYDFEGSVTHRIVISSQKLFYYHISLIYAKLRLKKKETARCAQIGLIVMRLQYSKYIGWYLKILR